MKVEAVETIPLVKLSGRDVWVDKIDPPAGYKNSSVRCRSIEELIGVISHGIGHTLTPDGRNIQKSAISPEDALKVVQYLIDKGKAEIVDHGDGSTGWNIHSWGEPDPNFHFTAHTSKRNATIAS